MATMLETVTALSDAVHAGELTRDQAIEALVNQWSVTEAGAAGLLGPAPVPAPTQAPNDDPPASVETIADASPTLVQLAAEGEMMQRLVRYIPGEARETRLYPLLVRNLAGKALEPMGVITGFDLAATEYAHSLGLPYELAQQQYDMVWIEFPHYVDAAVPDPDERDRVLHWWETIKHRIDRSLAPSGW